MSHQDAAADHVVAVALKIGAYTAYALLIVGLVIEPFSPVGGKITAAGLVVLLATPGLRIIVAGVQFLRERDFKYALVSLGVLCIVLLAYFLGIEA